MWRWLRPLLLLVAFFVALSFVLILPLRWVNPPVTAFMLRDHSGRDPLLREWTTWDELGTAPVLAVVAAEDQKFADHFGLDMASISKSIEVAEAGGRLRGASTISQQVSKNLFLWPGKSLFRKGLEAYLTVVLEVCLPKRRILTIYLNIAEFGPGIYGAGAASKYFFNKPATDLSDAEAALLAAVLPNPIKFQVNEPSAYVLERQRWILGQVERLRRENWISVL
ncbi:MAG TPA: monofunctional biosynthetic peptidoglycan transglycosylase [Woeseiaceae bacterium]|nr:monofunctional biosynthetic peptidoglycan transglycosylase [Woeseiaceae bacterium]